VECRDVSGQPGANPIGIAKRGERGVVLLVALVTSVALAYASMALLRAASTSSAVVHNLHGRQAAMLAASAAIETAVAAVFRDGLVDPTADNLAHGYYASQQADADARGVPPALQSIANYPADAAVIDVVNAYRVRHVVERLCLVAGEATSAHCTLSPPSVAAAQGVPPPGEPPRQPSYRISVRVDAPAGAATFVQAIVSPAHANPRLSWRVLEE
jgi:Tfp pilus assembly protein PilX